MTFYTFLPGLLNMSLTAGVAIVSVLLMRLLLRKAPKCISYALWGVVLFRLLCPVSVGSGLSLYVLLDAPTEVSGTRTSTMDYVPADIVHTEYPMVFLPVPGVSGFPPAGPCAACAGLCGAECPLVQSAGLGGLCPLRQGYGDEL